MEPRKYRITLTDNVQPGVRQINVRVPDNGPVLHFDRSTDETSVEAVLVPDQARRLWGFDVEEVKPVTKMKKKELEAEVESRGLEVEGSGADGAVTVDDLRDALAADSS